MNNTTSMDLLSPSFTPSEQRYYYGAYLNSAQNNIFNIEAALRKHLSASEDFYTNKNKSELDKKQYVDFIATYFPIIHQLGESYSEKLNMFHLLSLKINQLRNYFSHYYHADLKFDNSILLSLDKALLHAVLKVKSGRMKGESTRQILNTSQKETFSLYVDTCKRELRKHCQTLRKEASNEKDPKKKGI